MIDQIIANNTTSGTQFIDLGLPSGTLWADRNIGAGAPEDYGDHFRWGETTPFTENSDDYEYRDLGENIAGTEYDVATSMLGKGYQMPTEEQLKELKHYCTWEQSTINDVYGMKVTGPNGNSIFLPAAGFRYNISSSLASVGKGGYYWIATHDNLICGKKRGNYLMFNSFFCLMALYDRGGGSSVRPVMTVKSITSYVTGTDYAKRTPDGNRDRSFRKHMHPQGFTIDAEGSDQESMLQFILHMKRIETVFHGIRMQDLKRYGIEYTHPVVGNPRQTPEEIKSFVLATEDEYKDPDEDEE